MPLIDCPSVNSYRFNDVQRLIFVRGMVVQRDGDLIGFVVPDGSRLELHFLTFSEFVKC